MCVWLFRSNNTCDMNPYNWSFSYIDMLVVCLLINNEYWIWFSFGSLIQINSSMLSSVSKFISLFFSASLHYHTIIQPERVKILANKKLQVNKWYKTIFLYLSITWKFLFILLLLIVQLSPHLHIHNNLLMWNGVK